MAKDAYYFSHDSSSQDDPKCMTLIDQLGMEGYGIFWALIEKLRNETDYKLPLNITVSYAKRWGTSKEKVDTVVKNYGLFVVNDEHFYSERLLRSMNKKTEIARKAALLRWGNDIDNQQDNANAYQTHTKRIANGMQNDAIKVKESKGKESKDINIAFDEFWNLYDKKVGEKDKLKKKWELLKDEERELAMKHIPNYKLSQPEKKFRKDPSTYLNNKSFNDEIIGTETMPLFDRKKPQILNVSPEYAHLGKTASELAEMAANGELDGWE